MSRYGLCSGRVMRAVGIASACTWTSQPSIRSILLRRKAFQPAQERNQAVIKRLVKLLIGLLDMRRQVLDELSVFKKQNTIRRRQIYPLIDRSIEALENLRPLQNPQMWMQFKA